SEEAGPERPPDVQIMLVCDVQHTHRAVSHQLRLAPPQVEKPDVEERIRQCEGVLKLGRQADGAGRTVACAIRETEHPQRKGRGRKGRDPWVVAEAEPARPVTLRLEGSDRL